MGKFYLIINLLFITYTAGAQTNIIRVIDAASKKPVTNVLIFQKNSDWSVTTNAAGKAEISGARDNLLLYFQHPSYHEYAVLKENAGENIPLIEKIIHIEGVVVSANRWEQDIGKVAEKIMSVSRKKIDQIQPQTSADMLAATGQVFVQKSQFGGGSPMLRGFAANNVLLVIDGVRMNNAIYRSGNLQNVISIDPLALEGMEVVFGPGSVIYGSDALGGVMDFHTITPDFGTDKTVLSGQALTRYSSANDEKTGHLHFTIGTSNLSFFSSISYNDFDDLRAGSNYQGASNHLKKNFIVIRRNDKDEIISNPEPNLLQPSGYNFSSLINKLKYRIKSLDITYSFYYSSTNNIPRYDRLTETDENGLPAYSTWHYGPQQWMMNNLRLEYHDSTYLFDRLRLTVANQQVNESRHNRRINTSFLRNQYEDVNIWSVNLDLDREFKKSSLYYGIEVLTNIVKSKANHQDISTGEIYASTSRYPSAGSTWDSYAFYLSYSYDLGKIHLNSGGRYSYISLDARNKDTPMLGRENVTIDNGALTGSFGAAYKHNAHWRFRTNLSSGFRAPNIDDVGKIFEVSENTLLVPNKDLEPQLTYSVEASTLYTSEKWMIDLTAYQTWVDQIMTRNSFTINGSDSITIEDGSKLNIVALTNSGKATIHGVTASVKHEISSSLGLTTNITYTWGEEKNGGPLRHIPPVFGQWNLLFTKNAINAAFYMDYHFSKEAEDIPATERNSKPHLFAPDGSSSGWFTINLSGSYNFPKGFTARLKAENLLDIRYRPYSSGISSPGRNFSIALSKTF